MLTADTYQEWLGRLELPEAGRAVIDQVRSSPPSRHVRSAGGNVSGRFPSRKMGVTIQFESHRVELAGIHMMEHDPAVLEYYDQPAPIKLNYRSASGRSLGVMHTPDFFVLREDAAGWEEWKSEDELLQLAGRMPGRYVQEDGQWRCQPGEEWATPLGLFYRLRSSKEINWVFQRNLQVLGDYFSQDRPLVQPEMAEAVQQLVSTEPGIALAELLTRLKSVTADAIYSLIVSDQIYVDVQAEPLAEPRRVRVFRDAETARAYLVVARRHPADAPAPHTLELVGGASVCWDGRPWTIANVGERETTLVGTDSRIVVLRTHALEQLITQGKLAGLPTATETLSPEARQVLAQASPSDLGEANRRHRALAPQLAGGPSTSQTPPRTLRHWMRLWRHAEQAYGAGFLGLVPRHAHRGNRRRKLPENTMALMHEFIRDHYETLKQKRKATVYAELLYACQARGVMAPSYKTFAIEVRRRPRLQQIERRRGPRAAYAHQPFHWELTMTTPRHGDRPFEIGHIDHTELDVELVCTQTGTNLGRPWLTILIDAYSRRFLAIYLTFDPPSYRSAMMVLRECVRRHGRLPHTIVVDGGREFQGQYFETFLARYACVKKTRPPAKARFGSVCERLFGTANTQFIHTLIGNTQIMRQVRQVTKAVNPKQHARWTLERLYERLCQWTYEVYDTAIHQTLGITPREASAAGVAQMGERAHRRIPYDEDFLVFTLPTTSKGTAKVDSRHGVKINYLYYWADAFRDGDIGGRQVPVRYDPFNVAYAYVFVRGQWVRCIAEHHWQFDGRSERELKLATAELHAQKRGHTRSIAITARQLGDFLTSVEAEEKLLPQRRRDAAGKGIHLVTTGDRLNPDPPAQLAPPRALPAARPPAPLIGAPADVEQGAPPTPETYGEF
jgi:transposase InsO family protein